MGGNSGGGCPRKGPGGEGNMFANGGDGKNGGGGGRALDSCDDGVVGNFSTEPESVEPELTRRGIRFLAMSSNTERFCKVAKRQSIFSPLI